MNEAMGRFKVGQRAVRRRHVLLHGLRVVAGAPMAGCVYRVRDIRIDPHYLTGEMGVGLWLEEIVNPPTLRGVEPSYSAVRFIPIEGPCIEPEQEPACAER